ncbi:FAD-binding protein [Ketobacter sp. MCCC 1A13808]|uniref:cholesterol oxidase substrate-binding domain-containing protein n=1 Tax=Ketobacter sp. MCCC 1A13808 TaxID=2602738 RepID=UPI000F125243|nr:cholesterol oxidase substrate-binding domain-containing protein [Ketobacter sp. MCCC 1A13808]MVF11847.1 FAD-binding protein [Ketobacter sp. MCCC 1A13808]RLP55448.1 MAG: FAD-binding protein [Ketobacter sp.]
MSSESVKHGLSFTRRKFMGAALAAGAVTTLPGCKFVAGSGSNTIPEPPDFPPGIELYQQGFINWARETKVSGVWSCSPVTADDVVTLANWAKANNYRLRPFGSGHGFAPTLIPRGDSGENILLVHTHDFMNQITVNATEEIKSVTVGAGAYIEDICAELELYDLGLYHTTAPGGISIAGALAMNTHGAATPMTGETLQPGHSWGTLSNLPLAITAVVWDDAQGQYALRTFQRDEPGIGPLLTCLARAFITEVKLQVGPNLKIRCQSHTGHDIAELLATPETQTENSFANMSANYGTTDIIWYPLSSKQTCWVKTWTVTPEKPDSAREVFEPYTLSDGVTMAPLAADVLSSALRTYPKLAVAQYNTQSVKGVDSLMANEDPETKLNDLWGSAYTQTLYVQPLTPRVTVAAWGVIVSRDNVQRALSDFYQFFTQLVADFKSRGLYPYTGPVELRAHGLDNPADILMPNAVEPIFSGARPHPDHPEKDTVIWYAINNNVDQPDAAEFNTKLEQWFISHYSTYGIVRPEWTKCYAYSEDGPFGGGWSNDEVLLETFPDTWRTGYPAESNWDAGVAMLNSYDPHRVFTNTHLDKLFPVS